MKSIRLSVSRRAGLMLPLVFPVVVAASIEGVSISQIRLGMDRAQGFQESDDFACNTGARPRKAAASIWGNVMTHVQ